MSADRELLELAAKAAGFIEFTWNVEPRARKANGVASHWNPLTDDGDALRLAVKLNMLVDFSADEGWVDIMGQNDRIKECYGDDPMVAVRRAIVRAAAEIGRAIP